MYNTQGPGSIGVSLLRPKLTRHQPGAADLDFSSAVPSDLSGSITYRILLSQVLASLEFMRKFFDSPLNAAKNRYRYDYDKRIRKTQVSGKNEVVFAGRLPLSVKKNTPKRADKATYSKLIQRADAQLCIVGVQQEALTFDKNEVSNKKLMDRATHASSGNTNASVCEERSSIEGV